MLAAAVAPVATPSVSCEFQSLPPAASQKPSASFGPTGKRAASARLRTSPPSAAASPSSPSRVPAGMARASGRADDARVASQDDDAKKYGVSSKVIGVLGGGQLGRMLCQAASTMALKVLVLDPQEDCPASAICYQHIIGSFNDGTAVSQFAKRCDVLTVEIEHVDAITLESLEQQGIDCQPNASTIRIIQDKYSQKVHFSQHAIPLPDFLQIDDLESAAKAAEKFGYPLMIKSKRLAYDGRGNAVAHRKEDLPAVVETLGGFARGLYVEKWTSFTKELSVIVARDRDGSMSCYPVVETVHRDNICHIVEAAADVSDNIRRAATDVAQRAIGLLSGAGVFAVELFLTKDGQVLLNEVAPRPHNSGHHTIESCYTSQYEQHLRAILGLPLGDPSMKTPAAIMYNILGEDEGETGFRLAQCLISKALTIPGATVHWYDKSEVRKQRKIGHITIVGPSKKMVKARLDALLEKGQGAPGEVARPRVAIIMGSDSDLPTMKDAAEVLDKFGVPFELTIVSAHRTPDRMYSFASSAWDRGVRVIIAGAGGAAHLPGMVASLTALPVIGVPIKTASLNGVDSLLSIVQMPKGIPVATVAIGNAANAGLLALRMLAADDEDLWVKVNLYQQELCDMVLQKADRLESVGWEKYLSS